ncbi:MAG: four helix bundle protein [Bacteroidales bacterium]
MSDYNLIERTSVFGEEIVRLCISMPKTVVTTPLISQLIRSGTSIGANYAEADDAESKNDFRHKIGICKKESVETKFFLRMLKVAIPEKLKEIEILQNEATEFNLIFNAIFKKVKSSTLMK